MYQFSNQSPFRQVGLSLMIRILTARKDGTSLHPICPEVWGFFTGDKMSYQEWKELYIATLKNKIKSHKYSVNYTEHYINELCLELLERGGFDEDYGHWECVTAEHASQESFKLWLDDYFTDEE